MKYGTKGTMGVDYEQRIDFDRLRKDRMRKVQEALGKIIITKARKLENTKRSKLKQTMNHESGVAEASAVAQAMAGQDAATRTRKIKSTKIGNLAK